MSNLNSRSKLTEFPPLEPDEKPDGLKFSFSKFIWWKKGADERSTSTTDLDSCSINSDTDPFFLPSNRVSANNLDSESCPPTISISGSRGSLATCEDPSNLTASTSMGAPDFKGQSGINKRLSVSAKSHLNRSDSSLSNPSPELLEGNVSPFEARTLPNVLRRISNLIAMGSHNQTDIKKYWMPDSVSKECYECAEKFTTFRRKHHCRICGQIFCSRCCSQEIPGKIIGYSGDLRVCTYCCKIVLSYLNSADLNTDLTNELRLVQEDLQSRFGGNSGTSDSGNYSGGIQPYGSLSSVEHIASYRSLPRRKASLVYQEERFVASQNQESSFDGGGEDTAMKCDWVSIKALWDDMCHPSTGVSWTASHRQNTIKNCMTCAVGSELVDWLLAQRKISWRGQGVQIGQMLLDVNLIECVSQVEQVFLDAYALYRPVNLPLRSVLEEIPEAQSSRSSTDFSPFGHQDPLWMKQINTSKVNHHHDSVPEEDGGQGGSYPGGFPEGFPDGSYPDDSKASLPSTSSLYSLDLNTTDNSVSISKPKEKERVDPYNQTNQNSEGSNKGTPKGNRKPPSLGSVTTETMTDEFLQNTLLCQKERLNNDGEMIPPSGWHLPQQLTTDDELMAFQHLCNAFIRHENELLVQLLERMNLPLSWADIILPIVHKVTEIVRPDVKHADDDMDIRQYVQFKKVEGGCKEDCRIVNGVVCTKNVAHRRMRTKLKAPKVLLIGSSIDYQRFENRFLSLEPLVMQEYDYLKNTVSRISSLSPNLVLVEKSVSRLAQEFLLEIGITLVLNVKSSVMERVARSTQGVIESSADTPIGRPQLGLCHNFYLETFTLKDGSSKTLMFFDGCATHLGCTVLLRGGNHRELVKVKKIMSLMMLVAYNWRLERSFHIDLFAMPPNEIEQKELQRKRPDFSIFGSFSLEAESQPAASSMREDPASRIREREDPASRIRKDGAASMHEDSASSLPEAASLNTREKSSKSRLVPGAPAARYQAVLRMCQEATPPGTLVSEPEPVPLLIDTEADTSSCTTLLALEVKSLQENDSAERAQAPVCESLPVTSALLKTEICDGLSDPLQSAIDPSLNKENFESELALTVKDVPDPVESITKRYSFKKCLSSVILSASPFINYTVPYLETEEGKQYKLRSFFPEEIYWSSLLYGKMDTYATEIESPTPSLLPSKINHPHPFVFDKMSEPLDSDHVQGLVADFRRKGHCPGFNTASGCGDVNKRKSDMDDRSQFEVLGVSDTGRVESLDPFKHQKLSVLFCSFSLISCNFPSFCVNPWVVNMDMYGRNDISLGMFLERYCFRKTYLCPSKPCDQPMISSHVRRFVHEHGCVTLSLKELPKPIVGATDNILMWNWCSKCETVSPIVPMSSEAWSLSFAKYLELRFQGQQYTRRSHGNHNYCPHSLHHQNVQYFAQNNIVCSFKYSRIKIWEVSLPLTLISVKTEPKSVALLVEDVKCVAILGHGVYANIFEILVTLREHSMGLKAEEVIKSHIDKSKEEQTEFRTRIEEIQMSLTSPNLALSVDRQEIESDLWKVTDSIGFLRSYIADTIQRWNTYLQEADSFRKKEEKQAKATGKQVLDTTITTEGNSKPISRMESEASLLEALSHATSTTSIPRNLEESMPLASGTPVDMTISTVLEQLAKSQVPTVPSVLLNPLGLDERNIHGPLGKSMPASSSSSQASPSLPGVNQDKSKPETLRSSGEYNVTYDDSTDSKSDRKSSNSSTVKTLMSHFMPPSGGIQAVPFPWLPNEHHLQACLTTIPITVYENEPSSLVAFALSSTEYQRKRMDFMKLSPQGPSAPVAKIIPIEDENTSLGGKKPRMTDGSEDFSSSCGSQYCTVSEDKVIYFDDGDDKDMNSKAQAHIEVQFASVTAKFYCRVYFAEKFRQLRKMCVAEGEEFYVRSISRCVSWAASGGKSGSNFCKTIDDRFVIKQMSKFEIDSFLDIAPNYFKYMKGCYQDKKPTVLAKIVGVYRIGFKNSQNNAASKQDILVMENLFYQRQISQKFDLKGSIRNRLATANGKVEDLVLLDENLVNMACESPLYIRPHTKTVLTMAISNDSKFLASQMVMDYSLLVGLDDESNELVVGIIDYIRTFTWDKKIEAFVKSSGILGGQGKTPTVISPEEYQTRFCEAMYRYFLLVPDRWMGLGLGVDS